MRSSPQHRELADSAERMRSVVEHVLDGIITIDVNGRIETFNTAAERLFGYGREDVLGHNVSMLMPEPYRGEHDGYIGNYLGSGEPKIIGAGREVLGRRRDGSTFPMELAVSEFTFEGQRYFTGIVRDVSERKRLEREIGERIGELAEADRQKNEFLAMLAHEMRNPLAPIRNSLHLLKMPDASGEMVQHARQVMERQLQQLVRLVDDLLDLARIIRGQIDLRREVLDVAVAVARAVETVQPELDARGHRLEVALPEPPVYVDADLVRLSQAISNLLNNAARYTEQPGVISLGVSRENGDAVIRVRDPGIGIAPERIARLFELFVRGERAQGGSQGGLGIGLTLVRRLVTMHGGQVSATSGGPGHGSEFVIRLPAVAAPVAFGTPVSPEQPPAPAATKMRVLVVDDNVDAADSIALILQLSGFDVHVVYDGPSVLAAARAYHPDAVVLDIGLPGMSGYDVARLLRQQPEFQRTLLIAVTGYGQEADRRRSDEAGIDHHLTKPVEPDALQGLLQRRAPA